MALRHADMRAAVVGEEETVSWNLGDKQIENGVSLYASFTVFTCCLSLFVMFACRLIPFPSLFLLAAPLSFRFNI